MSNKLRTYADWGNYPRVRGRLNAPADENALAGLIRTLPQVTLRGNARCYGDAALGPEMISMLAFNQVLEFDRENGTITCEAGVLLADLLPLIVPAGWFFQVTPGIKSITVGGAIASDVHGKNHPEKGCFSNWLDHFDLMLADGSVQRCSRTENPTLFWQTCGGMGWTGAILRARFRLLRIQSTQMEQMTVRAGHIRELLAAFYQYPDWPYAAAWIDCLAGREQVGKGVVLFARHAATPEPPPLEYRVKKSAAVPFYAPSWILNTWSIGLHNRLYDRRQQSGVKTVELDQYFYPLDRIRHWNRLYGRGGFVQYQFCLPESAAAEGFEKILQTIQEQDHIPFLSVLKRHGERPEEALHSFPERGFSLALDFPIRHLPFMPVLDDLVWQYGGKIYLTKDACSHARMGRVDPRRFGQEKFWSMLKGRILNGLNS